MSGQEIFLHSLESDVIYDITQLNTVLEKHGTPPTVLSNKQERYINLPVSFDIETSSFYENDEKRAVTYLWAFGYNGDVFEGRTWKEFSTFVEKLVEKLNVSLNKRLVVYVHNLSYEFQFFRKMFSWDKVFSINERKPVYARTTTGIEFRCSYILSGYNLDTLGKNLQKYKVTKMTGAVNYNLIRHPETPLHNTDKQYCGRDTKVVMAYIQECIENEGNITNIPLTKTGYVRRYCRKACLYGEGSKKSKASQNRYYRYRDIMRRLRIDVDEYNQLKRALLGGFTHASCWKVGKVLNNVRSFDFSSAYPAVMIAEKFPMSKGQKVNIASIKDFYFNLKNYCCMFDVKFTGLQDEFIQEHYISLSRCWGIKNAVVDNGRVVSADEICTTITEQDFFIIEKFYSWKTISIKNFIRYRKGYLPTDFVKSILELYEKKTILKGVKGMEIEYLGSKEKINSAYGMCVTDICRSEITYITDWGIEPPEVEKLINKYNKSKNRFLFYPWGVWVTAYNRKNLFSAIYEFNDDYVYSDTDSIKGINCEKHIKYIQAYNDMITEKIKNALNHHKIEYSKACPKTVKGVLKPLGVWDDEGTYDKFKTLGAKRYMYVKDGEINITVSGLNKNTVVPYLLEKFNNNIDKIFNFFNNEMYIPKGKAGKNIHTYVDDETQGVVKDYLGNPYQYHELSSVHLEPSDYSLKLSKIYSDFLMDIHTISD